MTSVFLNSYLAALAALLFCLHQATVTTSAPSHVGGHAIQKRSFAQLCTLMSRYTNRHCTDYINYGCFCGSGGVGDNPVDDVDRCCYKHDKCYGDAECYQDWYTYFTHYTYKCEGTTCECTDSSYWYPCARSTCQCDVEFVECLAQAQYKNQFWYHNRRNCN